MNGARLSPSKVKAGVSGSAWLMAPGEMAVAVCVVEACLASLRCQKHTSDDLSSLPLISSYPEALRSLSIDGKGYQERS